MVSTSILLEDYQQEKGSRETRHENARRNHLILEGKKRKEKTLRDSELGWRIR